MSDLLRLFVAIDLPDPVRDEVEELQAGLGVGHPVPPENLHLTLCFPGEQDVAAAQAAHEALAALAAPAFDMRLAGIGTFGAQTPRVVFADVAPCPALGALAGQVTRALRSAGLLFEKRRFRPHVTLARLPPRLSPHTLARFQHDLAALAPFRGSPFRVAEMVLYRSQLARDGARHDALASYPLADA